MNGNRMNNISHKYRCVPDCPFVFTLFEEGCPVTRFPEPLSYGFGVLVHRKVAMPVSSYTEYFPREMRHGRPGEPGHCVLPPLVAAKYKSPVGVKTKAYMTPVQATFDVSATLRKRNKANFPMQTGRPDTQRYVATLLIHVIKTCHTVSCKFIVIVILNNRQHLPDAYNYNCQTAHGDLFEYPLRNATTYGLQFNMLNRNKMDKDFEPNDFSKK
eukprot:5250261-Pyramimonas_sp.AAC.1